MINNIRRSEKLLKVKFKDKSLILAALTHKSANQKSNNEKLEFLGDRVLGLVLSKKLFDIYPNENEGVLDKRFANLVKRETCCDIAWSLGLQNLIITGNIQKRITIKDKKILSDSCEAIIGAIFIDNGIEHVKIFINKHLLTELQESKILNKNYKGMLIEKCHKLGYEEPAFQSIELKIKNNIKFQATLNIQNTSYSGFGDTKKNAEINAAKKALKEISSN